MKQSIFLMIIALSTVLILDGCATTASLTYLPADIKIVQSKDAGDGKYLGIWTGSWSSSGGCLLYTTLVIEEINSQKVKAIYSWGDGEKDWMRIIGTLKNGIIVLDSTSFVIIIAPTDGSSLSAEFKRKTTGDIYQANFRKYIPSSPKK